ncbi:hypothetical protein COLO4_06106 [Corchorus olitorius]|uniref:Uncharacterized protein n=1 Tax=Corchorus olitorius TaxID=93759 RepID=A0A1R3KNZ4_9ROSI|nr:hypothetical protein COLO4_06106 [Corchorus olitorius]
MGPVFKYVICPPSLYQMPLTNPRSKPSAAGDTLDPNLKWIPRSIWDGATGELLWVGEKVAELARNLGEPSLPSTT